MKMKKDIYSTSWTGKEILETEMPEVQWLIDGLLPQGLFWIAGKKKIGKSYLVLQLISAITSRNKTFLGYEVKHGRVLYISFEDNPRRMKKRLQALQVLVEDGAENIEIELDWEPLNKGGYDKLMKRLASKKYVLCILDTWSWSFELKDSNKTDEAMRYLKPLHNFTKSGETGLGIVDHHHKTNQYSGEDWIDDISGTGAKGGIADTVWSINRKRGHQNMTLNITSKDIDEGDLEIKLILKDGMLHKIEDNAVKPDTIQSKLIDKMTLENLVYISEFSNQYEIDKSVASREMSVLVEKGIARQGKKQGRRIPYHLINGKK